MADQLVHVASVTDNTTQTAVANLSTVGNLDGSTLDVTLGRNYQQGALVVGRTYTVVLGTGANAATYNNSAHTSCDAQYAHFRIGRTQAAQPGYGGGQGG